MLTATIAILYYVESVSILGLVCMAGNQSHDCGNTLPSMTESMKLVRLLSVAQIDLAGSYPTYRSLIPLAAHRDAYLLLSSRKSIYNVIIQQAQR